MKIVCERSPLLSAFQTAALVAPTRTPKAILKNVKFEAAENVLVLMATDLEVGIRIEVEGVEIQEPGSIVAPITQLASILRESVDDRLRIEADAQRIVIEGERSRFVLPEQNPDEFPNVVCFEEQAYHEISARLFRELIRRTLFATESESSRYALGGVYLEFEPERITAVATDGRRLAKMEGAAQAVGTRDDNEVMTIVPNRAMQLMERAITEVDANIHLAARHNDILVRSSRAVIYSRLVEGRFPRWRDVFPQRQESIQIDLAVGPLYSALRQASIVASDESRGIGFEFGEGNLVLTAATTEIGQSRVELPIPYTGAGVKITLDHRFVADFLRVLAAEQSVRIDIENGESAALFTTEDGYGYVVMPLARDA
jgi:DNA polymerase-3 subunit beta